MEKAMVFAAGLGTRLRPLTDSMPKALVKVCGKPLLQIVLEKLAASGFTDIVVNVHHFAGMIEDFLASFSIPGVSVRISDESAMLLDTGGGIRHAAPLLGDGDFLVHNVDILSDIDLVEFSRSVRPDAVATLAVSRRKSSRYLLFDDDMRLAGWMNGKTGEIRSPFGRIDAARYHRYAFSGIHILSHNVFALFRELGFGERFPIMDFYLAAAGKYPVYGSVPDSLELLDVGKPESLALAADFLERCR